MKLRVIYVDVLIAVNVFVDFMLIACTKKFLHIKIKYIRMILGSILGGILSLVALLPNLIFPINIAVDLFSACLIILASFGKCNFKTFLKRVAVYFSLAFSFCGIMLGIYTALKPKGMAVYNDVIYFNISPILLIILTLVCYYTLYIIQRLTKGESGSKICNIEVKINENSYSFLAKVDTGCNLKEPFSGDFVIIAEETLIDNYTPSEDKVRMIPFQSLGGNGIIKGFKPNEIKIDGIQKENSVYIGICSNVLTGDIKALIPEELAYIN